MLGGTLSQKNTQPLKKTLQAVRWRGGPRTDRQHHGGGGLKPPGLKPPYAEACLLLVLRTARAGTGQSIRFKLQYTARMRAGSIVRKQPRCDHVLRATYNLLRFCLVKATPRRVAFRLKHSQVGP